MPSSSAGLPQGLDNAACRALIEGAPMAMWLPLLEQLQRRFGLPEQPWSRIITGSNALFALGDDIIVKLVPPNWRRQGDKEILVTPLLQGRLSIHTPCLIGGGEIDGWVFVITSRLRGTLLADVWPALEAQNKRAIMQQTGEVLRELRAIPLAEDCVMHMDWSAYLDTLVSGCVARHRRNGMPESLSAQVMPYLRASGDFAPAGAARFIHMDFHPWNLMARQSDGQWRLDGLLDFGDAIIGNSDWFELLTPAIFMAQGQPALLAALCDSYGISALNTATVQRLLTATMLIRPDSNVMFCMQQVPVCGPRDRWEQIAPQMFPF